MIDAAAARTPIVVIGGSAGGVEAVTRIVLDLPSDFGAAVFVTLHFPAFATSVMPQILERAGKLPATHAEDGEPFEPGHIYVAPPDRHLLIHERVTRTVRGPRESGNRPAIDAMFRSAAVFHGRAVVGVVLTGGLDDGTAGLLAVKRRGGIAIVQDPAEALFSSMPASAIDHVTVDWVLPLSAIAAKIEEVIEHVATGRQAVVVSEIPIDEEGNGMAADDPRETKYDQLDLSVVEAVGEHPGKPSQFGCPDCGGVLWEIRDENLVRFRCRVGHTWSATALVASHHAQLDNALWIALRALEESASLNESMGARARRRGKAELAEKYEEDARSAKQRGQVIRDALARGSGVPAAPGDEAAD